MTYLSLVFIVPNKNEWICPSHILNGNQVYNTSTNKHSLNDSPYLDYAKKIFDVFSQY